MKAKIVFIVLFLSIISRIECQTPIKVGDRIIKPEFLDSSKFSLFGTWKIIYRTYVAEREHTYEILPLEQLNEDVYKQRKQQGELIYGSYVSFSESLYIPYTTYLPKMVINPIYKKTYSQITSKEKESDPRWGDQKLLLINILCPLSLNDQIELSIFALTNDMIVISYNNANTFFERVKDKEESKNTWKKDKEDYFYVNLMGSADLGLFIESKNFKNHLSVKYELSPKTKLKYNFIDNKENNACNNGKTKVIYTTRNKDVSYPLKVKIPLNNLNSNLIKLNIGTETQSMIWILRWKIVNE